MFNFLDDTEEEEEDNKIEAIKMANYKDDLVSVGDSTEENKTIDEEEMTKEDDEVADVEQVPWWAKKQNKDKGNYEMMEATSTVESSYSTFGWMEETTRGWMEETTDATTDQDISLWPTSFSYPSSFTGSSSSFSAPSPDISSTTTTKGKPINVSLN